MLNILGFICLCILIYFILSVILYTVLLFGSFPVILKYFNVKTHTNIEDIAENENLPPVTIIIPMYNEREFVKNSLLSALNSAYRNLYVILVNDGSTDESLDYLIKEFKLKPISLDIEEGLKTAKVKAAYFSEKHSNLMIVDKENGGAADALNVGLNVSFTPYVYTLDADSVIHPHAVTHLMYEILINKNAVAIGGGVYLLNGCTVKNGVMEKSILPFSYTSGIQSAEYLRSHLFNRTGWNYFGGTMSYSGTATLFHRKSVIDAGGFDINNFAQDTEIIMRLHKTMHDKKQEYHIGFNPVAAAWTDVPSTVKSFGVQRDRWCRGMLRSVFRNISMLFNPNYKIQGLFSFPAYIFMDILAPYVEFLAYFTVAAAYYLGILDLTTTLMFIILAWGFASYITVANTFVSVITFNRYHRISDVVLMLFYATLEMFGFRQYRVLVNVYGTFHYLINRLRGKPL